MIVVIHWYLLTLTPACSHLHQTLKDNAGALIWQSTKRGTPPPCPRNIRYTDSQTVL